MQGNVFYDRNFDGLRGPQDPHLLGWTLYLDVNRNGVLDNEEPWATTDAHGNYSFSGLDAGEHRLGIIGPTAPFLRTPVFGGSGGGAFEAWSEGSLLAGFVYSTNNYPGGNWVIESLQPIIEHDSTRTLGETYGWRRNETSRVESVPGYGVAGMKVRYGHRLDGFQLLFMRVDEEGVLDPNDSYWSPWCGGTGGGGPTLLGGSGNPIIGIHGRAGYEIDAIGLMEGPAVTLNEWEVNGWEEAWLDVVVTADVTTVNIPVVPEPHAVTAWIGMAIMGLLWPWRRV